MFGELLLEASALAGEIQRHVSFFLHHSSPRFLPASLFSDVARSLIDTFRLAVSDLVRVLALWHTRTRP
jgi:hypothetical protein